MERRESNEFTSNLKASWWLIPLVLLIIGVLPACYGIFKGESVWTKLQDYTWENTDGTDSDVEWEQAKGTVGQDGRMLKPYESETDTSGKTYHFIIGNASLDGGDTIFTKPINSQGYTSMSIQLFESTIGKTIRSSTAIIEYNHSGNAMISVLPKGSLYPSNIYPVTGYQTIPAGNHIVTSTYQVTEFADGSVYVGFSAIRGVAVSSNDIYLYDTLGIYNRIAFEIATATTEIDDSTQHLLIRLNRN